MLYIGRPIHTLDERRYKEHDYGVSGAVVLNEVKEWGAMTSLIIGEHGRGRKPIKLLVRPNIAADEIKSGLNPSLTIGTTKSGRPCINRGNDKDIYMLLSSEGRYTRRGDGYIGVHVDEYTDISVLAWGNGADGLAGRIGRWDCALLKVPEGVNTIVKVRTSGAGYGTPTDYYVVQDGKIYHTSGEQELSECLEALGVAHDYPPQFVNAIDSYDDKPHVLSEEQRDKMVAFEKCGILVDFADRDNLDLSWVSDYKQRKPHRAFSMAVGTIPGYSSENLSDQEVAAFGKRLSECMRQITDEMVEEHRVYAAMNDPQSAYSVYPQKFGAPAIGEKSFYVSGVLVGNVSDKSVRAFEDKVAAAMTTLKQSTVTIDYEDGSSSYIKNNEQGHEISSVTDGVVRAEVKLVSGYYDLDDVAARLQNAMESTPDGDYYITGVVKKGVETRWSGDTIRFTASRRNEFAPDSDKFMANTREMLERAFGAGGDRRAIDYSVEFVTGPSSGEKAAPERRLPNIPGIPEGPDDLQDDGGQFDE